MHHKICNLSIEMNRIITVTRVNQCVSQQEFKYYIYVYTTVPSIFLAYENKAIRRYVFVFCIIIRILYYSLYRIQREINTANKMSCMVVRIKWKVMLSQLYCLVEMKMMTTAIRSRLLPLELTPSMLMHSTMVWHTLADHVFEVMSSVMVRPGHT